MMNTPDLIRFICERNIILCGFVDKLRAAGFDLDYRTEVLSTSDRYLEATDFLLEYQYGKC